MSFLSSQLAVSRYKIANTQLASADALVVLLHDAALSSIAQGLAGSAPALQHAHALVSELQCAVIEAASSDELAAQMSAVYDEVADALLSARLAADEPDGRGPALREAATALRELRDTFERRALTPARAAARC